MNPSALEIIANARYQEDLRHVPALALQPDPTAPRPSMSDRVRAAFHRARPAGVSGLSLPAGQHRLRGSH